MNSSNKEKITNDKIRLDIFLVQNNFCKTRSKAKFLILDSKVKVNNKIIKEPSFVLNSNKNNKIEIIENFPISRGYYKLKSAIKNFDINMKNKIVLDIGTSTGGFSQAILENNPKLLLCIEGGMNQISEEIKNSKFVKYWEKTNFLNIDNNFLKYKIDIITCDVSFVSIKKITEKLLDLKLKNFTSIFLFKPQFEIGKEILLKSKGYVNKIHHKKLIKDFYDYLITKNFKNIKYIESPILGAKKKNIEFFFYFEYYENK